MDIAVYLLLGISFVVGIMLVVGGDGHERQSRQRQEAIQQIVRGAEDEMDLAASRHHEALNEIKRRSKR